MTIYDNGDNETVPLWQKLLFGDKAKGNSTPLWSQLGNMFSNTSQVPQVKIPGRPWVNPNNPIWGGPPITYTGSIPAPGTIDWSSGTMPRSNTLPGWATGNPTNTPQTNSPNFVERYGFATTDPLEINWADDPYLKALYSSLGGGADTSGYDRALKQTADERKRMQKRYNTYSAQISDVFGNLSRKTLPEMLTATAQSSEAIRAQEAAQQAKYAQDTRSSEQARLDAANAARAGLGLEGSAQAGATGDLVTQTTEAGLADKAGMDAATLQTILTNEAIAKGDINRQISGLGYAQDEALRKLSLSREDALAALAAQEAQIQTQRSQAITAAQPSTAEQLAVIQAAEDYKQNVLKANSGATDPASQWLEANPDYKKPAQALIASFLPWFYSADAPAVNKQTQKTPTFDQYLQEFAATNPQGAQLLANNPPLRDFLKTYLSTK